MTQLPGAHEQQTAWGGGGGKKKHLHGPDADPQPVRSPSPGLSSAPPPRACPCSESRHRGRFRPWLAAFRSLPARRADARRRNYSSPTQRNWFRVQTGLLSFTANSTSLQSVRSRSKRGVSLLIPSDIITVELCLPSSESHRSSTYRKRD